VAAYVDEALASRELLQRVFVRSHGRPAARAEDAAGSDGQNRINGSQSAEREECYFFRIHGVPPYC
jgi:hypothetical protein